MKKLFLLFSHTLTKAQQEDAFNSLGVEEFVSLPIELQTLWSNIPPQLTKLDDYLEPLKAYIRNKAKVGDVFLIQGDFGACCQMVNFVKELGFMAVYSTTIRNAVEKTIDGKIEKVSCFEHVIFRLY